MPESRRNQELVRCRAEAHPAGNLAIERAADYKSEFFNGRMYAMSGASQRHNRTEVTWTFDVGKPTDDPEDELDD